MVNVKDYGATGNGSTDDAHAIQAAITAVTGTGGTVFFPPGKYKVASAIVAADNVALIGSGVGSAIIAPAGSISAVRGNSTRTAPLTRFTMAHLSIDGANQGPQFNVGIKGVFCQYLAQCQFEDLVIQNCAATGLGIDFLSQGTVIHAVRAIGNGRLNRGGGNGGGSSGIGIGTGQYPVEDFVISDCYAAGNGRYGIFIESQSGQTSYGMRIANCFATGNLNHGFGSAGGNGAVWSHCVSYANNIDGFSIDNGTIGTTAQPSSNDVYVACESIGNSRHGFSYQPTAVNANSPAGGGNHVYSACVSRANSGLGFNIASLAGHPVSGLMYTGCSAFGNGMSGLAVQGASSELRVSGCVFNANGQKSTTSNAGILLGATVTNVQIIDCRAYDSSTQRRQTYGIQVDAGAAAIVGDIHGNDLRGNTTGAINVSGGLQAVVLRDNLGYDPLGSAVLTPGKSPFAYTAGATDQVVTVAGGAVSGINYAGQSTGLTSGSFALASGQTLTVTYTAPPTMVTNWV
ncbi:MAG TPA: glycosyl hydrolase family 28-related protein [Pseudonocardiaceae bacterium]|nr:glycosyl hydrolase family 28-related protein [Pseudonocardiaceae bacterium]